MLVVGFIPFDPNQPLLLPSDLRGALSAVRPSLPVSDDFDHLGLSEIASARPEARLSGAPILDPRLLLHVYIHAKLMGVRSSPSVAQAILDSAPFRVLARNTTPG